MTSQAQSIRRGALARLTVLAAGLALVSSGCSPAPSAGEVPTGSAETNEALQAGMLDGEPVDEVVWTSDGRALAVLTWGSADCAPQIVDLEQTQYQELAVSLADTIDRHCGDDTVPRVTGTAIDLRDEGPVGPLSVVLSGGGYNEEFEVAPLQPEAMRPIEPSMSLAWLHGGSLIAVYTSGSSTPDCAPQPVASDVVSSVELAVQFETPGNACNADLGPQWTLIEVPDGIDASQQVEVSVTGAERDETITLPPASAPVAPAIPANPDIALWHEPEAAWLVPGRTVAVVTWAGEHCATILEDVSVAKNGTLVAETKYPSRHAAQECEGQASGPWPQVTSIDIPDGVDTSVGVEVEWRGPELSTSFSLPASAAVASDADTHDFTRYGQWFADGQVLVASIQLQRCGPGYPLVKVHDPDYATVQVVNSVGTMSACSIAAGPSTQLYRMPSGIDITALVHVRIAQTSGGGPVQHLEVPPIDTVISPATLEG